MNSEVIRRKMGMGRSGTLVLRTKINKTVFMTSKCGCVSLGLGVEGRKRVPYWEEKMH